MIETQDNPIVPRGLRVPPASRPNYCVPLLRINEITTRNLVYGRSNSYPRPWNVLPFLPTIFFLFSLLSSSDSFRHSFFIFLDSRFSDDRNRRRQCVDIVLRKSGEIIFSMVNLIRLCFDYSRSIVSESERCRIVFVSWNKKFSEMKNKREK